MDKEVKRCTRCLMPATRPDTEFSGDVCSACIAYQGRKDIDWQAREKALYDILDKHHGECVVPSSGGKDSHWQVLTLLEMGAHVTIVTATTCHLTAIGRRNIDNLSRFANTIEITPNRTVRAKLNRLSLELLGDISWPEHVLIHTQPFAAAIDLGIPLVFYGENPLNQYGGPKHKQTEQVMTRAWVEEFGGFLGMRPSDFVGMEGITERDMYPYGPHLPPEDLDELKVYFLGQFLPWDSWANAKKAIDHGFETSLPSYANWWPFENLDNAQTGIHDYMMWLKYGYGRACAQLSVDIRRGDITRAEALLELPRRDGHFPTVYAGVPIGKMLDNIGMTLQDLEDILAAYDRHEPSNQNHTHPAQA
jgi:N-acetyl sugar amidotransferase